MPRSRFRFLLAGALTCLAAWMGPPARADIEQLQKDFQTPPDEARIMVRWWWFGPAVTHAGIERELRAMKAGGIGGFEVQPTYPLVVDGTGENGAKNLRLGSPEFLEMLNFTAGKARELGLRMDLTLASGWPYGGPIFAPEEGTKQLQSQVINVAAGQRTVAIASRTAFAAFAGPAGPSAARGGRGGGGGAGGDLGDLSGFTEIPLQEGVAQLPANFAGGRVLFFDYKTAGLRDVKRPAIGGEGLIIDHLSAKVVDKFIEKIAEPELKACGSNPPFAFFCDSLEVTGENWTEDFLAEFQKRRGYDLKPLLPALVGNIGERTADIQHDFGKTVTELFNDNFNKKFEALARKYGTRFRIQGYGSPPAGLFSYAYADLPEGEGGGNGDWRTFRTTRYAASASHLMGQTLASSETFTWLHAAPFRATPLDIKGEVDTHFLDGINQIDCHGWPYTPESLAYPGGSFYAAAVFDDKNPWYVAMPEISRYMQRVSQMMREGVPANDVALYANESDVWSGARTSFSSLNAAHTEQSRALDLILDAGYNLDLFDDGMLALKGKVDGPTLAFGNVKYPIVVLNGPTNMPLATARQLEQFTKNGGTLVSLSRTLPTHVPGYKTPAADQAELAGIMGRLFGTGGPGIIASSSAEFSQRLLAKLPPDFVTSNPQVGAVHRRADGNDVYFVANTSASRQSVMATIRQTANVEQWNPLDGTIRKPSLLKVDASYASSSLQLELEPYGSTLIVFTNRDTRPATVSTFPALNLSAGWHVTFAEGPGGKGSPVDMEQLTSWTQLPNMQNYSGTATYEKKITVTPDIPKAGARLTFGVMGPATGRGGGQGFAAAGSSPVRDAAVVYINGKRVGAAWCPPFEVDVSGALREGENTIRIDVGNTAVNYLAKAGFPNYDQRAVDAAFPPGRRFSPQGVEQYAQPLPSGLLGPIKLEPKN